MFKPTLLLPVVVAALVIGWSRPGWADGAGVLIQRSGDRLTLGFDTGGSTPGSQGFGRRAFGGVLNREESITQEPSFLSLTTPPTGSEALPIGSSVEWDFLPLTIDGVTSNLMHWSGAGDLELTPPSDEVLTLFDPVFTPVEVDGSAAAVAGLRLGTTMSDRYYRLHAHRNWYVAGPGFSLPSEGVYVAALRVRLGELTPTVPFFVALGTPGLSSAVFDIVVPWLEDNADSLILRGDFNFNGTVDRSDHALWAAQFGDAVPHSVTLGEADGNYDGVIDAADYTVWRDALAEAEPPSLAATIPEPAGVSLVTLLAAVVAVYPASREA